jgi:hypothetical protein
MGIWNLALHVQEGNLQVVNSKETTTMKAILVLLQ